MTLYYIFVEHKNKIHGSKLEHEQLYTIDEKILVHPKYKMIFKLLICSIAPCKVITLYILDFSL